MAIRVRLVQGDGATTLEPLLAVAEGRMMSPFWVYGESDVLSC